MLLVNKEVVTSYPIKCIGSPRHNLELKLPPFSCDASLMIYKDGRHDVGCTFFIK